MSYSPIRIEVGDFYIASGISDGCVWIGRARGDSEGEGGDFSVEKLQALLSKFYDENF